MPAMAREVFQKNFKAIILKQDFVKTKLLIKTLSKAEFELLVVPEYSLSHYFDKKSYDYDHQYGQVKYRISRGDDR
jgi:hypothetical protein